MRYLKIAGLCLASMLVMGMALAGNASALPLWLVCLEAGVEGSPPTKYTSNQCTKAAAGNNGKWQSLGLPCCRNDTVRLLAFSLRLVDNGTFGGATAVKCNLGGRASGVILNRNRGVISLARVEEVGKNCERVSNEACKGIVSIEGRNLPWETEIEEVEGKFLTKIKKGEGAAGEPGWAVTCETIIGNKTDECTNPVGKEEKVELPQGVTGGILLVLARFEGANKANCSEGGTEKGEVAGLAAILLTNGNGLSINKE
jgi:hypothetical protein